MASSCLLELCVCFRSGKLWKTDGFQHQQLLLVMSGSSCGYCFAALPTKQSSCRWSGLNPSIRWETDPFHCIRASNLNYQVLSFILWALLPWCQKALASVMSSYQKDKKQRIIRLDDGWQVQSMRMLSSPAISNGQMGKGIKGEMFGRGEYMRMCS
jgi:hypothetical protein